MSAQKAIGAVLAVLGVGVMIYSRVIRPTLATVPPSKEEVTAHRKRRTVFGAGAALSLFGLLLLLVP